MSVKKIGLALTSIALFIVFCNAIASEAMVDETPHFEKCLRWTRVCEKKVDCTDASDESRYGCYHCIKPGHYGFHIFPTQMNRMSCNPKTVDYLRNMGYNCYKQQQIESNPCMPQKKLRCESKCVEYAK